MEDNIILETTCDDIKMHIFNTYDVSPFGFHVMSILHEDLCTGNYYEIPVRIYNQKELIFINKDPSIKNKKVQSLMYDINEKDLVVFTDQSR